MLAERGIFSGHEQDKVYIPHLEVVKGTGAKYYNQRFLGKGGNGSAFLVTCLSGPNAGLQVVLKAFHRISDNQRRKAFLKEIEILKTLDHPAIVKVFDQGVYNSSDGNNYPFVVTEFVPKTARQMIEFKKGVERLLAIRITMNCLSGLSHLHTQQQPIIHRDLKPENILISPSGARIADFGLAKMLEADTAVSLRQQIPQQELAELNSQGNGMPRYYRTPEAVRRFRGERVDVTTASDVFQLGSVFYELLTGFNPQVAPQTDDEMKQDIQLNIKKIKGRCGMALGELIKAMLSIDALSRPTASVALTRLDAIHQEYCAALFSVTGQHI